MPMKHAGFAMLWNALKHCFGLPGGTRTPDLLLRRQLLYPVELRAVWDVAVDLGIIQALQDGASLLYRRELR